MRLHKPVAPHEQPHLQGFFQGGIPTDGRYSPNSMAPARAGFDDGGSVPDAATGQAADQGSAATVTPTTPGQWSDEDEARLQATNNTMENSILSRGLNYSLGKLGALAPRTRGYAAGGQVDYFAGARKRAMSRRGSNPMQDYMAQNGQPILDEMGNVTGFEYDMANGIPSELAPPSPPSYINANSPDYLGNDQTGPGMSSQDAQSYAKSQGYDDGGQVSPDAYLQWPNQQPIPQTTFDDGGIVGGDDTSGEVNPMAMVDPSGVTDPSTQQLVAHSRRVYDGIHARLEAAFNAAQSGGADNEDDTWGEQQDVKQPWQTLSGHRYAGGGGIPAPPGPAGPGVRPQAPTGNAGRPNWTAPNPQETASEKNYTQNVTSRPATSPARGTAFPQPGPDGGQRGQEWYGKGVSPYGAGRKKKNG